MSHTDTPNKNNEPINLLRGWPASSLLPTALVLSAAHAALSDPSVANAALAYGPDPGYEPARVAIAKWLSEAYAGLPSPITPERLCITGGASQNLGCLLNVYTDPAYTRRIWIVAPSYFLAFRIFEDAGFAAEEGRMRAVPEDGEGLDLAFLEREVERCERAERERAGTTSVKPVCYKPERTRAKVYRHVVYCVPSFANPSSRSMSLRRRRELVRLARKWDMLCIADDVYDFLLWDASPAAAAGQDCEAKPSESSQKQDFLPRLVDIDRDLDGGAERQGADGFGNACSNGSFSKIAGPGVRCGWVEGTKKFAYGVSQTGTTCSGGAPSQLTSTFMTNLLQTGQLQNHIQHTLQPAYAKNYHALHDAITTHLMPLGFTLPQPTRKVVGGFFVWLSLPEGMAASDFARVCKDDEGVIVAPGGMFEVPGDEGVKFEGKVRLCFAWEEEGRLVEGVRRMKRGAEKLLAGESGGGEYVIVEKRDVGEVDEYK